MKFSLSLLLCCVAGWAFNVDASPFDEVKQKAEEVVSELSGLLRESTKLVKATEEPEDNVGKKPWFCHKLDCPGYDVVRKTKAYELRKYNATSWVSTKLEGVNYDQAADTMFMRLFRYIEGNNVEKKVIPMTAPVIVRVMPGQGPTCANNFTMSFFMSPNEGKPPAPVEEDVVLSSIAEASFYVSMFGGREHQKDWLKHADILAADLKKEERKFDSDYFYTAGYDSPFRLIFRHNEIWFMAK